ncbi:MAG: glutamate--tRNA ligase family protein [Thermomicrobiales bacterium]
MTNPTIAIDRLVRVRYASHPTGLSAACLHHTLQLPSPRLRRAAFAYGTMILRIEDTDRNRLVEGATEGILEILHWFGASIGTKASMSAAHTDPMYRASGWRSPAGLRRRSIRETRYRCFPARSD